MNHSAQISRVGFKGYTLLELLLAMFLGNVIILSMTELFLTGKSLEQRQLESFEQQQAGYFTARFLRQEINLAGYSLIGSLPIDQPVSGHDELFVRYDAVASNGLDCLGSNQGVSSRNVVTNRIWLDAGELKCNEQALLDEILAFQVSYGIDADGDGIPERYRQGINIDWDCIDCNPVVAVRTSWLTGNGEPVDSDSNYFDLLASVQEGGRRLDAPEFLRSYRQLLRRNNLGLFIQTVPAKNIAAGEGVYLEK